MPSPDISVIIVNYGTAELTMAAVDSVLAQNYGERVVDIHVVDNASPGEDAASLQQAHSDRDWGARVTLYLQTDNLGFGAGNNGVLEVLATLPAPPEMVFLLNPDASLSNNAIALLAEALQTDPKIGFAGAAICTQNGEPVTSAFRFPGIISEFIAGLNFGPVTRIFHRWWVPMSPDTAAGQVDWVSGAAVMMRMSCLLDIGFFDPDFFLYYEEVELMHRGRAHGWSSIFVPAARVIHVEGAATGMPKARQYRKRYPAYWYRSWRIYFLKTSGRSLALLAALGWVTGAAGNHVISWFRRREPFTPLYFFGDCWAYILRPLLNRNDAHNAR